MAKIRYLDYLKKLQGGEYTPVVKIYLLNPDESHSYEFSNSLYNITGTVNVNYQNGARRTCSITIDNSNNQFPVNVYNIWLGSKFQVYAGIMLDDGDPYLISQGIFYVKNPKEVYNPNQKTIQLQGVDKWAYLDGSLFGSLRRTYISQINQDIRDLTNGLLRKSRTDINFGTADQLIDRIDPKDAIFDSYYDTAITEAIQYFPETGDIIYKYDNGGYYIITLDQATVNNVNTTTTVYKGVTKNAQGVWSLSNSDSTSPPTNFIPYTELVLKVKCPYTATQEVGKNISDILLEYATMLRANVYYDNKGYLRFEPISSVMNDIAVDDKDIIWKYTVTEKEFLGLNTEYKFTSLYNDIIVLGKVTNGKQAKARLQNQATESQSSIDKIGIKTKVYQSDQYNTDSLCLDLARWYAEKDMALEKSGTLQSLPLYHADVNTIVTVSTPNNKMSAEKFLINSYSLNLNPIGTMSLNITNIRKFDKWTEVPLQE